jgi:hypothetical protein
MAADDGEAAALPYPDSLCHRCAACRPIHGRATTFLMCTALPEKYPRQPVLACAAFRPRDDQGAGPHGAP